MPIWKQLGFKCLEEYVSWIYNLDPVDIRVSLGNGSVIGFAPFQLGDFYACLDTIPLDSVVSIAYPCHD